MMMDPFFQSISGLGRKKERKYREKERNKDWKRIGIGWKVRNARGRERRKKRKRNS